MCYESESVECQKEGNRERKRAWEQAANALREGREGRGRRTWMEGRGRGAYEKYV